MKKRNAALRKSTAALNATAIASPRHAIVTAQPSGPRCPKCKLKTQRKINGSDGRAFWGCPRFPHCRGSISIPASRPRSIDERSDSAPAIADPLLARITRRKHRAFAADIVRRARVGDEWSELLLGAARAAFPKSRRIGDEAMRERARELLNSEPIYSVVRALLDEQP